MSEPTDPTDSPDPKADGPSFDSSNAILVGLVIIVLIGALGIGAVALFKADQEDVVSGDTDITQPDSGGTRPDVTEPTEPTEPAGPVGADSALVGLSEAEVRELYPLVRVVEIDGEPLMTTMDLQMGRLNLALEGDQVVGAFAEGCDELGDDAPDWARQACDPDPSSDGPTTFGKLLADPADETALTLEVGTQGDQYHQGMTVRPVDDTVRIVTLDGSPISADDLLPDDVVWIWTGECRESSPVQCDIHAVVVDRTL